MKLQEFVQRVQLAVAESGGTVPDGTPYLDPQIFTVLVLPRVFQIIAEEAMQTPGGINALRRDFTVRMNAGRGTLPPQVLEKYSAAFYIKDGANVNLASLEQQYFSFLADDNTGIPKFYVEGQTLYYRGAGSSAGTSSNNLVVSAPAVPTLPTVLLDVTAATNASPIVVTTDGAHGMATGDKVYIYDVVGNPATNGFWTITSTGSTTFSLDGSTGNGTYSKGGYVRKTPDWATTDIDLPDYLINKAILIVAGLIKGDVNPLEIGVDPVGMNPTPFTNSKRR